MISPEQRAEIRRLFYAEHWRVGTIASHLGVHHATVQQAIERDRFVRPGSPIRRSISLSAPSGSRGSRQHEEDRKRVQNSPYIPHNGISVDQEDFTPISVGPSAVGPADDVAALTQPSDSLNGQRWQDYPSLVTPLR